jgi:hypothetical protein
MQDGVKFKYLAAPLSAVQLAAIMQRFERFSSLPTAFAYFSVFACSRTHRILSGDGPESGVENVCGLTGRARYSGRYAPSLR